MPHGRLLEYCVDLQHLSAHRTTASSSRAKFKVGYFWVRPRMHSYGSGKWHRKCEQ